MTTSIHFPTLTFTNITLMKMYKPIKNPTSTPKHMVQMTRNDLQSALDALKTSSAYAIGVGLKATEDDQPEYPVGHGGCSCCEDEEEEPEPEPKEVEFLSSDGWRTSLYQTIDNLKRRTSPKCTGRDDDYMYYVDGQAQYRVKR